MKITITATKHITHLDGVPVRLWNGVTEDGTRCLVYVHRVAVPEGEDASAFERELTERLPPGRVKNFWVIAGGESGKGARPCDVAWIRDIVRQCAAAGVPCFVKQLGSRPVDMARGIDLRRSWTSSEYIRIRHPKSGDPKDWPPDLRVREYPGEECPASASPAGPRHTRSSEPARGV